MVVFSRQTITAEPTFNRRLAWRRDDVWHDQRLLLSTKIRYLPGTRPFSTAVRLGDMDHHSCRPENGMKASHFMYRR